MLSVYVYRALALELTDAEATERFRGLIYDAIDSLATRFNFAIHNMAHRKKKEIKR
jgi:hypothetical protein